MMLGNYTWRAVQEHDLEALDALDAACLQVDGPASVSSPSYRDLLSAPGVVMLCATEDTMGQTASLVIAVGWVRTGGERVWLEGKVHPWHRRRGLGTYLLRWTEEQAEHLIHPATFSIVNEAFTEASAALYAREGYDCNFVENWMQRDLMETLPSLGQSFPSVPWTTENAIQFFQAYVGAFSERMPPGSSTPVADEWIGEYVEDVDFRPDLSLLALADGKPAGFITVGVMEIIQLDKVVGWISQVGSAPALRGHGVAAGLITAVMASFKREGLDAVGLHVNVNNPGAIHLYERLGFKFVG